MPSSPSEMSLEYQFLTVYQNSYINISTYTIFPLYDCNQIMFMYDPHSNCQGTPHFTLLPFWTPLHFHFRTLLHFQFQTLLHSQFQTPLHFHFWGCLRSEIAQVQTSRVGYRSAEHRVGGYPAMTLIIVKCSIIQACWQWGTLVRLSSLVFPSVSLCDCVISTVLKDCPCSNCMLTMKHPFC